MKNITKFLFFILISSMLILPAISFAAIDTSILVHCGLSSDLATQKGHPEYADPCDFNDAMDMVNTVISFILYVLAVPICAIMFAYAGILLITGGEEFSSARTKAKSIFTNAALGLIFVAGAWLIIRTVLFILGYDGSWLFHNF